MRNIRFVLIGAVSLFMLGGCSKYELVFDSHPRGATLICDNVNWGYTPQSLFYDAKVIEHMQLDVSDCSANWSSGYSANYTNDVQFSPDGKTVLMLYRPADAEGFFQDSQFALQVEQLETQKREAKATEELAYQQAIQSRQNYILIKQQREQNYELRKMNYQLDNLKDTNPPKKRH